MQIDSLGKLFEALSLELKLNYMKKSKVIILFFRLCNYLSSFPKPIVYLFYPLFLLYILIVDYVLGVEIPIKTRIGKGLVIYHGFGIVVNGYTVIGENCTLRQGVTIGNKILKDSTLSKSPVIGDNVEFGANVVVIGDIRIEDNARLGAGVVVTKSVLESETVISQRNRII